MVTNPDGTLEAKTLTELGVTSIGLRSDATHIELPNSSVITGQSMFVKNGETRTVADVTLSVDTEGHRVVRLVSTTVEVTTITNKGYSDAKENSFGMTDRTKPEVGILEPIEQWETAA